MQSKLNLRKASIQDLNHICELQNHHIQHTNDIYSEDLKNLGEMQEWWETQEKGGFPTIIAEINGDFAGFATYGPFRKRTCYQTTVEHSVYLKATFQGEGLGRALMEALFKIAESQLLHAMIGGIDSKNEGSFQFHQKLGFKEVGRIPEVAHKKGKWLELVLMQKIL